MSKKRICFFLHYFSEEYFPLYVQYYLRELSGHFDEVRVVTNKRIIKKQPKFLNQNIHFQFVKNEGYDFGMFYKGFQSINPPDYSQIACVNDSNLQLKQLNFLFEWEESQKADFWGMIDSHEAPWFSTHENNYHIQSHFIVFNEKAIALLADFFRKVQPEEFFKVNNTKQLRRKVINDWELGVTQFLMNHNLKSASYFKSRNLLQKYNSKGKNVTHELYKELLNEGYPLLKKKVVLEKRWKLFNQKRNVKKLIEQHSDADWNIAEVLDEIAF